MRRALHLLLLVAAAAGCGGSAPVLPDGEPPPPPVDAAPECVIPEDCHDNNPCTEDLCEGGVCSHQDWREGELCNDDVDCTQNDHCESGVCVAEPRDCSYLNDLCNTGICDEGAGGCVVSPLPEGTACDDAIFCTDGDSCLAGSCVGAPRDCSSAGDACHTGSCDEAAAACVALAVLDGTPCSDGLYCVDGETCQGGACVGAPRDCSGLGDACHTGVCDEDSDACVAQPVIDGTACADGLYCTVGDSCQAGACTGTARDCSALGDGCGAGVCDEAGGACARAPFIDGTSCSDGLACTEGDACASGACVPGAALACADADPCTADSCDEAAGGCVHLAVAPIPGAEGPPGGASCGDGADNDCDGLADTGDADCVQCTAAAECDDGNPCTGDACVAFLCENPPLDGVACDDGEFCTLGESCSAGVCGGGAPRDCSALTGACTTGSCDETADACAALPANEGGACSDGSLCTVGDSCAAGSCAGSPVDCSAFTDACNVGTCDALTGACAAVPANEGGICDDGLYCTTGDACAAGACLGAARDCSALSGACAAGSCDENADACVALPVNEGNACDDGLYCTTGDACAAGACLGAARDCTALSDTCNSGTCDEAADGCVAVPANEGGACSDGLYCTVADVCAAGACAGAERDCTALGNACNSGTCDEAADSCVAAPVNDGGACDDGLYCTVGDACSAGACLGNGRDCSALSNACNLGSCDEAGNSCVALATNEGGACSDGAFCTVGETCSGGACGGGAPRDCGDGNACTSDACDEGADACANPPVPPIAGGEGPFGAANCGDGADNDCDSLADLADPDCMECTVAADCDDGNACTTDACVGALCQNDPLTGPVCDDGLYCTTGDACAAGVCTGAARDCSALSNACNAGSCNEATDACVAVPANEGGVCSDGLYCSVGDVCAAGACVGGARDCSAWTSACTLGTCNETTDACVAAPANQGGACSDGLYCTVGDACNAGSCAGTARDCSALSNACNTGTCNEATDACVATPANQGGGCSDGLYCTVGDACNAGACVGGARDCSALSNSCNTGTCNEAADSCVATPANQGGACSDGLYCTAGDACNAGACVGAARDCSAFSGACTVGACDEGADSCVANAANEGGGCSDGLYCTDGDSCSSGLCAGGPRDCSALSGACTVGACDEGADSCVANAVNEGGGCSDGLYCTTGDVCSSGLCTGAARDCSALSNACNAGTCNEATDACVATPANPGGACSDGLYCTTGDACNAGACVGAARDCSAFSSACTLGSCDELADSCTSLAANEGGGCSDGLYCTTGDACSSGLCAGGPRDCSAWANGCNSGACNEAGDTCFAQPVANGTACDAAFCLLAESCTGGVCGGGNPASCSDGDACTRDVCNEGGDVCENPTRTVSAASLVTTSSDDGTPATVCLTAGSGARVLVWTDLVDQDGLPATGASVTIGGGAATEAASRPGTYYRAINASSSTGTTTVSVAATWCGATTTLATTVAVTHVAANATGGGTGGCSPADGNLRVRVVDPAGAPITGASVLVGLAGGTPFTTSPEAFFAGGSPAGSNTATTDTAGYATFYDYGAALAGPLTVTAGAASRAYFTLVDADAADVVLALPLRSPPPVATTVYDMGTSPTGPPTGCTRIDVAVVLPQLDLDFFSTFDTERLFEQNRCWNHGNGNINGGAPLPLPENVWVPTQNIGPLCLGGSVAQARWLLRLRDTAATGRNENVVMDLMSADYSAVSDILGGGGGLGDMLPITDHERIGFMLNEVVPTPPTSGRSINANETYPNAFTVTFSGGPTGADVIGMTGADYAGQNGVGPLLYIGHKVHAWDGVVGGSVAVENSDLNAAGTPGGVRRFATLAALFIDPDTAAVAANRLRAVTSVHIRDNGSGAAPFGAAGGSFSLTSSSSPTTFLGMAGTIYTSPGQFRWQNTTAAGNSPMYSVHELTVRTRRYLPVLACDTVNDVREELAVHWIVARPFGATCAGDECFTLPTLPAGFPEQASATQKLSGFPQLVGSGRPCAVAADCPVAGESCVDPDGAGGDAPRMCMGGAGTAASPYYRQDYEWRLHAYDLQLASGTFDFDAYAFASRAAGMTHESSNRMTFESGPWCYPQAALACGGSNARDTSLPATGWTDEVNVTSCDPARNLTGREVAYSFTTPTTRSVTVTVTPAMGVDLDVAVLSGAAGTCDPSACVAAGNSSATFTATGGQTYYVLVDGYLGAQGSYTVSVTCP